MAIYKRSHGFELGTTKNKSSKRPEHLVATLPPKNYNTHALDSYNVKLMMM